MRMVTGASFRVFTYPPLGDNAPGVFRSVMSLDKLRRRAASVGEAMTPAEVGSSASGAPAVSTRDQRSQRVPVLMVLLVVGLLALTLVSFGVGQYALSPGTVVRIVVARFVRIPVTWTPTQQAVVDVVRLPEILGALLVGAALSSSGAAYQTMLRNPLVSPDILGLAAGAGFGGSLSILLGLPTAELQVMAFAGGLLATGLALAIGRVMGGTSPTVLVLGGVVVGTMFLALIQATQYFANPDNTLPEITFWLLGSLDRVTNGGLVVPAVIVGVSLIALYAVRWKLTVLAAGEDEARSLGVNRAVVRAVVIGASTLMTATVVSIAGVVGWVGLLVPHLARSVVGPSFGRLLSVSCLIGAGFMLVVDDISRAATTVELPLGILTGLIGPPFFVVLLARAGRQWL
jgi:iron complex transport system permease protein